MGEAVVVSNVFLLPHRAIISAISFAEGCNLWFLADIIKTAKFPPKEIPEVLDTWNARLAELKANGKRGYILANDDFGVAESLEQQLHVAEVREISDPESVPIMDGIRVIGTGLISYDDIRVNEL